MTQYRAVVGIDYPPNKRVEAGELVSDLPEKSAVWLLANNLIEEVDGKKSSKKSAPAEETAVETVDEIKISDGIDPAEAKTIIETAEELKGE
jgi:hypothetical protein